jgi:hypothetical protein
MMNLVKPGALTESATPRILVKCKEDNSLKETFDATNRLREAGYMAEIDLGGQKPSDLRWTLDVRGKEPSFVLWDKVKSSQVELKTIGEVITFLEEASADKDSLT